MGDSSGAAVDSVDSIRSEIIPLLVEPPTRSRM